MCRRKLSAVIVKSSRSPACSQAAARRCAENDLVPRLGRRERAEVVLTRHTARPPPRAHRGRADAATRARAAASSADARPPCEDAVAIRARARREPRVEPVRRLLRREDGDVVGQGRVQRLARTLERRPALDVDARDLPGRVHAGVRASGDREPVPARKHAPERIAHDSLHRSQPGLARPAAEARAVVLEREPELHDVTSWRADGGHRSGTTSTQPRVPRDDARDVRTDARGEPGLTSSRGSTERRRSGS